jgi:DNA adenine methylase
VKAAVRYNARGEFNNSPDNRRKGARPEAMRGRIVGASRLLRGRTSLSTGDHLAVLRGCRPDDVVYLDPPYQGVGGDRDSRYCPRVDHDAFCDALAGLNRRKVPFLVSYDGRTGDKVFGKALPASLRLVRLELHAGRSSQATLLGRADDTYESLYLSAALVGAGGSRR